MVPRAVLMKSGFVSINTARQVNVAHSKTTVNAARPMVNIVKDKNVNIARPKAVVNVVKGNNVNVVKASACWVWKPKTKVLDHVSKHNSASTILKRHMTGNMSYLIDYEEIDGGYVAFGGNPKGGKIIEKVVTDDYSRFTWVFFLAIMDETCSILKSFITGIENLVDHKVKVIRCDNGTEFKNREMNQFCEKNGILRQYRVARTPQQNRVAKRRNRTLIEAARTMLVDSKLPTTFWAKAVNTTCYVQNRVLVVKPHNKIPYELFHGRTPTLSFMRPFSKAFRVFNSRTRMVEENLHIRFSDNTSNVVGSGPDWLFDIDALTRTMNYKPIVAVNAIGGKTSIELPDDLNMPALEDISIFDLSIDNEDVGAEAGMNNLNTTIQVSPILTTRNHKDHPLNQVIEDLKSATQTRNMSKNLEEHGFIEAMQEELLQFKLQEVWTSVDLPNRKKAIGTNWVFKNKKDKRGIVIRNKARLVAQGYTQEEGINYDEVFAPIARIEAIRLFLAYASFKDFVVYQMDVKSSFLYGKIEEEVYVCQPPGFEDPDFPDRVCKLEKALYGLHKAPRAWYETLSTYLLDNEFQRGKINKTLFIKRHNGDILLVQVYVDDIIFGSTNKELYNAFKELMHEKFQMSSMGELTFFLGLQVQQKKDGIFISQDKYVGEILKKFRFTEVKTTSTPMKTQKPLLKDKDGEEVDVHMYSSMIGSLMYLTSSRPNIMFVVCACARYQVNPKVSHLHYVKRIFRYIKGQPKLGLWYPKDSPFDLVAYINSDYCGVSLDKKSTTGGCQFLGSKLISRQCKKQTVVANSTTEAEYVAASSCCGQFWATVKAKTINGEVQLKALVDGKKIIITESIVRRDIQLEDAEGVNCLPNATIFKQLTLMGSKTTAWNEFSSTMASTIICLATNQKFNFSKYIFESMVKNLENVSGKLLMYPRFIQAFLDKQLEGIPSHKRIYVTPSHTKKIFGNMRRVGKGFSRRETYLFPTMVVQHQEKMGDDSVNLTNPHHTPIVIQPSTSQPQKKQKSRKPKRKDIEIPQSSSPTDNVVDDVVYKEMDDRLERVATTATSLDAEHDRGNINKTQSKVTPNEPNSPRTSSGGGPNTHFDADTNIFSVNDLDGDEVIVDYEDVVTTAEETRSVVEEVTAVTIPVSAATTTTTTTAITDVEMTLSQALAKLKSAKPKADKVVIQEPEPGTTTPTLTTTTDATTITAVSTRPKAKGLVIHEQEQAPTPTVSSQQPSHVKVQDKERLAREKPQQVEEANIAWDNVLAKIDADYQLAQRLQAQEQEELTDEEKLRLFVQFLEQRRKYFAAKRAEEKRNRPPTRAQQRSIMCTYVKNIEGWKPKSFENKSFANIQELFDKAMKRVNTFVDYRTELQKLEEDKESEELKQCFDIIPNDGDDVTIDATPLSTKCTTIVDYKIYKEGKKSYFKIIRADGNSQMYLTFGKMLKNFDREDLEVLWSIVKAIFKKTEPVNYMDNFLLLNLKNMFEHHVEDNVWKNQQGLVKVLNKKLYDSYGVHCVTMQNMLFYLLVEKLYPLTNHTLHQMFNDVKLQVDYECEMAFELLRLVKK
ncbi:putative ribonuclease H-like domain-containing protein [Tanacetum coccineum]|uniref:Ribonuclease H-like domain-containing protein n=1 Tax=Tanacetum coccineum TaxID=301880 RepID=A0ABQ5BQ36_9ASTR